VATGRVSHVNQFGEGVGSVVLRSGQWPVISGQ